MLHFNFQLFRVRQVTGVRKLSMGKELADHVFQTDTAKLLEPPLGLAASEKKFL